MPLAFSEKSLITPHILDAYAAECANLPAYKQNEWMAAKAAQFEVKPLVVRKIISDYLESQQSEIDQRTKSTAQKIATQIGATITKAMTVLNKGMDATKTISVEAVGEEDDKGRKKYVPQTEPDWAERRHCAKLVLEIHGAFAPQEINVNHKIEELDHLSDAELNKRIAQATMAYVDAKDALEARKEPAQLLSPEQVIFTDASNSVEIADDLLGA